MLIECLTRREGQTTIQLEKVIYTFLPIPGGKKGEQTTSFCEISTEKHLEYLLHPNRKGQFREYDPELSRVEMVERQKKNTQFMGYSIQKFQDSGYIVVDQKDPKHPKYAAIEGRWIDQRQGLTPFPTEFQAFQWLKEEVEFEGIEEPAEEVQEKPRGPGRPRVDRVIETIEKGV